MLYNKKGLSTIVTTLIIILLVLVAIGIIWVVIRGVIEQGTTQIDVNTKCIGTDVRATSVNCDALGRCVVQLKRNQGTEEIGGVKLIFHNSTNTTSSASSAVLEGFSNDITLLSTQASINVTGVLPSAVGSNSVDVVPYFQDDQGQDQLCTQINTFSF